MVAQRLGDAILAWDNKQPGSNLFVIGNVSHLSQSGGACVVVSNLDDGLL
jgi:hypothetical protein